MTKDDKEEIRQMFTDILGGHTENIEGKFNVINTQLDQIKEQTTKTNGRVTRLETKVLELELKDKEHIISCPINERVKTLEGESITTKTIRTIIIQGFTVAGIVAAIVYGLMELISK